MEKGKLIRRIILGAIVLSIIGAIIYYIIFYKAPAEDALKTLAGNTPAPPKSGSASNPIVVSDAPVITGNSAYDALVAQQQQILISKGFHWDGTGWTK